ncbi:hypothetical protein M728_003522 [Ensifer sp. WSM1721]
MPRPTGALVAPKPGSSYPGRGARYAHPPAFAWSDVPSRLALSIPCGCFQALRNHFPRHRPVRTLVRNGRPQSPSSSDALHKPTKAPPRQPQDERSSFRSEGSPGFIISTCLIERRGDPRHRKRKAQSHLVEMTSKLPRTDMIRVPCGSHLGRIARQDQSRFLLVFKRCQLTLAPRFACRFPSP